MQCYTFRRDRLRSRLRKFPDRCGLDRSPKYDRCCRGMEYYKDDASDLEDEDVSLDVPLRDEMGRLLAVAFDTLGM